MTQVSLPDAMTVRDMIRVAELIATRFSHDITGPIGAVNNGAEFLEEGDQEMLPHALELISSSAREAVSKVMFFRHCYGMVRGEGRVDMQEFQPMVQRFFQSGSTRLEWQVGGVSFDRDEGRLLANLIYLASGVLVRGGLLQVAAREAGGLHLSVRAEGTTVKCEEEWVAVLGGKRTAQDLTPRSVQIFLTLMLAADLGAEMHYQQGERFFEFTVRLRQPKLQAIGRR